MAFSALVSIWRTSGATYNLLTVQQDATGTDVTIVGEIAPSLKTEMRAVLLTLTASGANLAAKANILLDALDDIVVTDLEDNVITSTATKSADNRSISVSIAGSETVTRSFVTLVMPQTLVGIYSGASLQNPGDILLQTGVTPGSYTNANITIRADGRISVASNGTGGGGGGGASLTAGAVITEYLADLAVTDAKIAGVAAGKVSGLASVATSGAYSDLSGTPSLASVATSGAYSDLSGTPSLASYVALTAVPYDVALDYQLGAPVLNEVMLEITVPRAFVLGAPSAHYAKTLASGERPSTNGGSVLTVYRNSTAILTVTYATTGVATVAEPSSTVRSFAAGDVLKITCTTADASAKNHKMTLVATLT